MGNDRTGPAIFGEPVLTYCRTRRYPGTRIQAILVVLGATDLGSPRRRGSADRPVQGRMRPRELGRRGTRVPILETSADRTGPAMGNDRTGPAMHWTGDERRPDWTGDIRRTSLNLLSHTTIPGYTDTSDFGCARGHRSWFSTSARQRGPPGSRKNAPARAGEARDPGPYSRNKRRPDWTGDEHRPNWTGDERRPNWTGEIRRTSLNLLSHTTIPGYTDTSDFGCARGHRSWFSTSARQRGPPGSRKNAPARAGEARDPGPYSRNKRRPDWTGDELDRRYSANQS